MPKSVSGVLNGIAGAAMKGGKTAILLNWNFRALVRRTTLQSKTQNQSRKNFFSDFWQR
jgi:hypothetical protein